MAQPVIHITFVDASTGATLTEADLPADRLPASFETETTLHIANEQWAVIKAEPVTAGEFISTGRLVLTLSKLSMMSPKDILYTLPTLCERIPDPVPGTIKAGKRALELHEDDWRQIEFVAMALQGAIRQEMAEIERIVREESVDNGSFLGFKRTHLRAAIPQPLPDGVALTEIEALFPAGLRYEAVSFERMAGTIADGFAMQVGPLALYGEQAGGSVRALAIQPLDTTATIGQGIAETFARFMATHHLYLVDWCRKRVVTPDAAIIGDYLRQLR